MTSPDDLLTQAERLKIITIHCATKGGGYGDGKGYKELRATLLREAGLQKRLPRFLLTCHTLEEFWGYIKEQGHSWAQRESHLRAEFQGLLAWLKSGAVSPVEEREDDALESVDEPHLRDAWRRAFDRARSGDVDGAITAARTLIETACKHILDDLGVDYPESADLPKLYRLAADQLNLAPGQQTEPVFKQICGGCTAAVEGLGAVRNKLGDAHGTGQDSDTPDTRHAELAVNLAGTMTIFLVATWKAMTAEDCG
jgi:hypothetical protein